MSEASLQYYIIYFCLAIKSITEFINLKIFHVRRVDTIKESALPKHACKNIRSIWNKIEYDCISSEKTNKIFEINFNENLTLRNLSLRKTIRR